MVGVAQSMDPGVHRIGEQRYRSCDVRMTKNEHEFFETTAARWFARVHRQYEPALQRRRHRRRKTLRDNAV
ncbi:MAG: hypothetical protein A2W18_14640 [Candidatus Muproteobacteria bacterium RBG_16_60_9]|uniref:Uncharacterized protein n=1 Tax=Candidatus Muproteobacteria bacterium RBG_16_60_9 TaxID=1817755 RepID=A0A1F6UXX2_9PROT|nr:MAG: hypothetical protein A2W18_14640 [Candidatus Muproteobacteria bacterium RBG_16_60_9]